MFTNMALIFKFTFEKYGDMQAAAEIANKAVSYTHLDVYKRQVLELATGTGLIAKHIVNAAAHIEATDASAEMIAEAKRDTRSAKLHFSVQDMFCLPYAEESFDVVIVSNALHIVPLSLIHI